jgi:hypothetical protein
MGNRNILQMDQATLENKDFLRDKRKRGDDAGMDSGDLVSTFVVYQIPSPLCIHNAGITAGCSRKASWF